MGVPAVQVSGRLSESAAETLGRFPAWSADILARVTRFCVQGDGDRDRLIELGVDPARVVVTGSLKGDGRMAPSPDFPGRDSKPGSSSHRGRVDARG